MQRTLEIIAMITALIMAGLATHAWIASRDEQQRLQSTLVTQKRLLDAADTRERDRDSTLKITLSEIDALKRSAQTPEEILRALPKYLALPQPITMTETLNSASQLPPKSTAIDGTGSQHKIAGTAKLTERSAASVSDCVPSNSSDQEPSNEEATVRSAGSEEGRIGCQPSTSSGLIPSADLKPLYNYVQDCRACQAQVAIAKKNSADDAVKIAAITQERDAAISAAKSGSFFRRLRRDALWFIIGAAGGLAAARR